MSMINCPECGKQISDLTRACPGCGCPVNTSYSNNIQFNNKQINSSKGLFWIIGIIVIVAIGIFLSNDKSEKDESSDDYHNYYTGGYCTYSYDDYSSNDDYGKDASSIFSNLEITNFSCSSGKHSGRMSCEVTNNNSFTVRGYFRVNFYDNNGNLIYNQLMSLPDVASGEKVVCSTSIPKDSYPSSYVSVDFSQASLVESD